MQCLKLVFGDEIPAFLSLPTDDLAGCASALYGLPTNVPIEPLSQRADGLGDGQFSCHASLHGGPMGRRNLTTRAAGAEGLGWNVNAARDAQRS